MSLTLRYSWIVIATIIITLSSLAVFFARHRFNWLFRYNDSFLMLFGVEPTHVLWVRYLVNWLLGTCIATALFSLLINLIDAFFVLLGISGIPLDPVVVPLVIGGLIASIMLIIAAFLPVLAMPFASISALSIFTFLHLFGFYYAASLLGDLSTFLFFATTAIGFVGIFLSAYVLLRHYFGAALLRRYRNQSDIVEFTKENEKSP